MDAAWIKKELEAVDFTAGQANALAVVLSQMATKDDVQGLRQQVDTELKGLRQHVDAGFREVYQEIGKIHQEIGQIWWKVAVLMTLQAGLIVSLIKLL